MKSIPLVQESKAFAENLKFWCKSFDENRYLFGKRVNYSYRFSSEFIEEQNRIFQIDPSTYLSVYGVEGGRNFQSVFDKKLARSEIVRIIIKVVAHTLFRFIGSAQLLGASTGPATIYRKAYVDDIDLVYDRLNTKMVMAVYPFAVNLPRQIRFIRGLIHDKRAFKLDGYDYRIKFLLNFLRHDTVVIFC